MASKSSGKSSPAQPSPARGEESLPLARLEANVRTVEVSEEELARELGGLIHLPQDAVSAGSPLPVDLYLPRLRKTEQGDYLESVLFAVAGRAVSPRRLQNVRQAGLDYFYCQRQDFDKVLRFIGSQVHQRLADPGLAAPAKAHLVYEQAALIVEQAMEEERLGPNLEHGRQYVQGLQEFLTRTPGAMQALGEMLVLDYGLFTHSVNVCLLTTAFAHHLEMPASLIWELGLGALYHDLGKRGIPAGILRKPGPLDPEEWELMRGHPRQGYELLRPFDTFPQQSRRLVHQHHENLDGTGYPFGLAGPQLDQCARLIRLVDAYDAITSTRVYKPAAFAFDAIQILLGEMGSQISQDLLRQFITFLGHLAPKPGRMGRGARRGLNSVVASGLTKVAPSPRA